MLIILFQLGDKRYGLDTSRVVEIVPMMPLREVPGTPPSVAGLMECRGRVIPVIDLCQLTVGRPAEPVLSTRTILVQAGEHHEQLIALMAEQVTDTLSVEEAELQDTGLRPPDAPHLGKVVKNEVGELVHCVEVDELLTPEIQALLKRGEEVSMP
ncbi:MAG: chemotaxis protein CheW [Verrucomicrobiota bacterium]